MGHRTQERPLVSAVLAQPWLLFRALSLELAFGPKGRAAEEIMWRHKPEIRPAMSASPAPGQQRLAGRLLTTILTAATLLLTASLMAQPPQARPCSDSARSPFPLAQPLSLFKSFTTTSRMGHRLATFRPVSAATIQLVETPLAGPTIPAMATRTSLYAQTTMVRPIRNQVLPGQWMMSTASEQTALPPVALSPPTL